MANECNVLIKDKLKLKENSRQTGVYFIYSIDEDGIFKIKVQQSSNNEAHELKVDISNINLPAEKITELVL